MSIYHPKVVLLNLHCVCLILSRVYAVFYKCTSPGPICKCITIHCKRSIKISEHTIIYAYFFLANLRCEVMVILWFYYTFYSISIPDRFLFKQFSHNIYGSLCLGIGRLFDNLPTLHWDVFRIISNKGNL